MYEPPAAIDPSQRSIAFITMHKAGSSIADRIFRVYARHMNLVPANLAEAARKAGIAEGEFCRTHAAELTRMGYYFGPFRGIYTRDMGGFTGNRLIVQVRDPRDCICSNYFSMGWSHRLPNEGEHQDEFLKRRNEIQAKDINRFARGTVNGYRRRLEVINGIRAQHPDCLILKYETMVEATDRWRNELEDFLRVQSTAPIEGELSELMDFKVRSEDPSKHKRQVRPGDHKRKLKPETIEELNEVLGPVLRDFEYSP